MFVCAQVCVCERERIRVRVCVWCLCCHLLVFEISESEQTLEPEHSPLHFLCVRNMKICARQHQAPTRSMFRYLYESFSLAGVSTHQRHRGRPGTIPLCRDTAGSRKRRDKWWKKKKKKLITLALRLNAPSLNWLWSLPNVYIWENWCFYCDES